MKKAQAQTGRILSVFIALCMMIAALFVLPVTVNADDELTATDDPRESVMQIALGYEADDGTFTDIKWGTCFLINDEYVLTNKHVVTFTSAELAVVIEALGLPENTQANDSHFQLRLYVNKDMTVKATMHDSVNSDDMDFAAVKLASAVHDRNPIALGDSDSIQVKDEVYALGFPSDSIANKEYNTKEDVSTVGGTISKVTTTGSVDIIEHTATLNNGNSGGPLLDANNNVIGINEFIVDTKNYSIQINAIKAGLDTFGIAYIDGSTPTPTATPTPTPDPVIGDSIEEGGNEEVTPAVEPTASPMLAQLETLITSAQSSYAADDYSEESYAALEQALTDGQTVVAKGADATEAEITAAIDSINEATDGLDEKSGPNMILIIGIIAVVVIVLIIILVLVNSNKKKKAEAAKRQQRRPVGGPTGAPMGGMNGAPMNNGPMGGAPMGGAPMGGGYAPMGNDGSGETTLLNEGSGETTLLGGGSSAFLVRRKTGERININRQSFKIGKEKRRVDYCVSDNPTVSRLHCEIIKRGADYYVIDQGSANCTFVNGIQISPNKETLLTNMSTLKLSDEEFEFHA